MNLLAPSFQSSKVLDCSAIGPGLEGSAQCDHYLTPAKLSSDLSDRFVHSNSVLSRCPAYNAGRHERLFSPINTSFAKTFVPEIDIFTEGADLGINASPRIFNT